MSQTTKTTPPPEGYMRDAMGRLVPNEMVRPIDKLRDQTVIKIVEDAVRLRAALEAFKLAAFSDIAEFVATSAEQFDSQVGGTKGNVTLRSYDGRYKVERAIQEHLAFDERLQAAKSLIDGCIERWSEGSRPEIKVLVNDAFQVDKQGRISTNRVLGLRRLEINDETWRAAMDAIAQSVTVVGSRAYVRLYERVGDTDRYEPITLDIASL